MLSILPAGFNDMFASLETELDRVWGGNEKAEMCSAWLNNDQEDEKIR